MKHVTHSQLEICLKEGITHTKPSLPQQAWWYTHSRFRNPCFLSILLKNVYELRNYLRITDPRWIFARQAG